jgi:hypothetical protein
MSTRTLLHRNRHSVVCHFSLAARRKVLGFKPLRGHMKRGEVIRYWRCTTLASACSATCREPGQNYRVLVSCFPLPVTSRRWSPSLTSYAFHGFVEGRNLAILPGGLQFRNEQITELV